MIALVHETNATVLVDNLHTEADADWWRDADADLATGPLFTLPRHTTRPVDT
jgi:EAL domain-containing protein (putative c-di-GMP-specific phosphodiesterase class I)